MDNWNDNNNNNNNDNDPPYRPDGDHGGSQKGSHGDSSTGGDTSNYLSPNDPAMQSPVQQTPVLHHDEGTDTGTT